MLIMVCVCLQPLCPYQWLMGVILLAIYMLFSFHVQSSVLKSQQDEPMARHFKPNQNCR